MQGLIFDIKRFAVHDGPGIRTTVFFKSCPLVCWWCHNPESRRAFPEQVTAKHALNGKKIEVEETLGHRMAVSDVMKELEKERVFMEESGGGVTFSGGEPLLQPGFLTALSKKCKETGIHTVLDTTGYAEQDVLEEILPFTDLFLYDLKLMDDGLHKKYTGVSNKKILDNLAFILGKEAKVVIRFPLVPGINDDTEHLESMAAFLQILPEPVAGIDILPFHALATHKYEKFGMENKVKNIPEPSNREVEQVKAFFEEAGFEVNIGG